MDGESHRWTLPGLTVAGTWTTLHDGVMGGESVGTVCVTAQRTVWFVGQLSLRNRGGFASIRTGVAPGSLAGCEALLLRVQGDGRGYSANLYLQSARTAFSYRCPFPTEPGAWLDHRLPFRQFVATSFGRVVPDAPPVPLGEVCGIGVMLSDGRAGAFNLEIGQLAAD